MLHRHSRSAFSVLEVLLTITVIGIVASIALVSTTRHKEGAAMSRLQSNVATVNQSIRVFQANGGHFEGTRSPQEILDRMKRKRSASDSGTYVGLSEEMLDKRIAARMQTADEAAAGMTRALWDDGSQRFIITETGGIGVKEFYFDESLALVDYGVDSSRDEGVVAYSEKGGWIWDYSDGTRPTYTTPTIVTTTSTTPPTPVGPTPLPPSTGYPTTGGPTDPPIIDPLQVPLIRASSPDFDYFSDTGEVTVELENPNPADSSYLVYQVDDAVWKMYVGTPFNLAALDFPGGATIYSRAIPHDTHRDRYSESSTINQSINPPTQKTLLSPQISLSADAFTTGSDDDDKGKSDDDDDDKGKSDDDDDDKGKSDDDDDDKGKSDDDDDDKGKSDDDDDDKGKSDDDDDDKGKSDDDDDDKGKSDDDDDDDKGKSDDDDDDDKGKSDDDDDDKGKSDDDDDDKGKSDDDDDDKGKSDDDDDDKGKSDDDDDGGGSDGGVDRIEVTLTDQNPDDTAALYYRLLPPPGYPGDPTTYRQYGGPFTVLRSLYPNGFGVEALARPLIASYLESPVVDAYATNQVGLYNGHLDLDTSTFIAAIGKGSTDAHSHDYTGKFDLTSIDMMQMEEDKQVEIDEAISNKHQKFKLVVINGDLSPGLRIRIDSVGNGPGLPSYNGAVNSYDDIALSDLGVYSMVGSSGSRKLTGLSVDMSKGIISSAGIIPTNTGDVKGNEPGKNGEWRNGAFTIQALRVNDDGSDAFVTDTRLSAGGAHGAAVSGLLWEATLFWHWKGDSYHEDGNQYVPGDYGSIEKYVEEEKK